MNREKFILRLFKLLGIGSFIASAAMLAIVIIMQFPRVQARYEEYLTFLSDFELKVSALSNRWLLLIVIILLFILRSLTPVYPFMALFIITGMVFEPRWSLLINVLGMLFNITYRYYTGVVMGQSWMNRALKRNPVIGAAFEGEGKANPWVLFTLRFVPFFPFGTVSNLYGSFGYPFLRYTLISIAGILPRLISYSYIGNAVYDPLSVRFYLPLIALTVLSGISFFLMRGVMGITYKITKKNTKEDIPDTGKGITENE